MPIKTRVLVVDDSALMRGLLSQLISLAPDMEVVGAAPDAQSAREMIKAFNPELGAIDFIGKPRSDGGRSMESYAEDLVEKIRAAKGARLRGNMTKPTTTLQSVATNMMQARPGLATSGKIIFVGASTGGTEAIKEFLIGIPADCPPILVVQHMPESFTASFARRLDGLCAPRVIESQGSEKVESGTVYIAPGHSHLQIRRGSAGYLTELVSMCCLIQRLRLLAVRR